MATPSLDMRQHMKNLTDLMNVLKAMSLRRAAAAMQAASNELIAGNGGGSSSSGGGGGLLDRFRSFFDVGANARAAKRQRTKR